MTSNLPVSGDNRKSAALQVPSNSHQKSTFIKSYCITMNTFFPLQKRRVNHYIVTLSSIIRHLEALSTEKVYLAKDRQAFKASFIRGFWFITAEPDSVCWSFEGYPPGRWDDFAQMKTVQSSAYAIGWYRRCLPSKLQVLFQNQCGLCPLLYKMVWAGRNISRCVRPFTWSASG